MQSSTQITDFESDKVLVRTLFNNFQNLLVFIFYADANDQSKKYLNNLASLIKTFGDYPNTKYFSVNAERCPETFKKYEVQAVPAVILTQTDKKILLKTDSKSTPAEVLDLVSNHSQSFREHFQKQKAIWFPKIQSILSSCPFLIFIKGTPTAPKCGFTEQLLQILNKHNVEYNFYDIIADEYMRYWLRNYNKWPTYPQVYIQGKLVGGLDVLKDLVAKGEFENKIKESMRSCSGEERYQKLIDEEKVIVFANGFGFENQETQKTVDEAKQRFPDANISIVNIQLDQKLKEYFQQKALKAPLIIAQKKVVV